MKTEQRRIQLVWRDVSIPVTNLACNYQMQVELILDDEDDKVWKFKKISDLPKQVCKYLFRVSLKIKAIIVASVLMLQNCNCSS